MAGPVAPSDASEAPQTRSDRSARGGPQRGAAWDAVIIGAGAAGLFCGIEAARRGRRVLILDHARAPGEKIRISGGGRCNFTNRELVQGNASERFLSQSPRFARSALSRYTPADFIARLDRSGIAWHEKTLGQLFCDGSAKQIIEMLLRDLAEGGGELRLGVSVQDLRREGEGFRLDTSDGPLRALRVVVATGGKSIPKMGASDWGLRLAGQFGLRVIEPRPALVPLTFTDAQLETIRPLAGLSLRARVGIEGAKIGFEEGLLFTHRGLSGPSILQISSYWREGAALRVDLAAGRDIGEELLAARAAGQGGRELANGLDLPKALAQQVAARSGLGAKRLGDLSKRDLELLREAVHGWRLVPAGSEGWRTAEVMLGGVDTAGLDARSFEARAVPGLHFIGEVVDVTGWLGGYNFQWAWSSGWAAGQAI